MHTGHWILNCTHYTFNIRAQCTLNSAECRVHISVASAQCTLHIQYHRHSTPCALYSSLFPLHISQCIVLYGAPCTLKYHSAVHNAHLTVRSARRYKLPAKPTPTAIINYILINLDLSIRQFTHKRKNKQFPWSKVEHIKLDGVAQI